MAQGLAACFATPRRREPIEVGGSVRPPQPSLSVLDCACSLGNAVVGIGAQGSYVSMYFVYEWLPVEAVSPHNKKPYTKQLHI